MNGNVYDRLLLLLGWLAPLSLLILARWQVSLETWYAPLDGDYLNRFVSEFQDRASAWLRTTDDAGAKLYLVVDRDCPCTNVTIKKLRAALAETGRKDVSLLVMDVDDPSAARDVAWRAVLDQIPATPTLLAVDRQRLIYAGPAISGNICSSSDSRVLGLSALQTPPAQPVFNLLDRGCYCRPTTR